MTRGAIGYAHRGVRPSPVLSRADRKRTHPRCNSGRAIHRGAYRIAVTDGVIGFRRKETP